MKQSTQPKKNRGNSPSANRYADEALEPVSGRWLVKAILGTVALAAAALYLTVCLLVYQGQWQFVFFPPKNTHADAVPVASIAANAQLPITNVQFDYTEEGSAQLDGWWVPAEETTGTQPSPWVVLFCPNGRTTLSGNVAALQAFHQLGVSVFAFDYRGFGASQHVHPSQQKAYADGLAALHYLTTTRHIGPLHIVIYGARVGAAVAVHTAQSGQQVAGVMLENPRTSFVKEVKREQHIHVLPLWLIFPDRFNIVSAISQLATPKLFLIADQPGAQPTGKAEQVKSLYRRAPGPKMLVTVQPAPDTSLYSQTAWQQAVQGFLSGLR